MKKYSAIPKGYMRIGEMAKKAGITVRTLSYYDKEGLLSPQSISDGGYRLYTDKDMVKLIQILMMKQLGFPLSEIKKRLTQLDTPEDVRAMLTEQSAHVRKKIEHLVESLDAMEALSEEIAQIEAVNFKKYADILLNLQNKNESYRMIKHFDDEALDMFRERIGRDKAALMTAALYDLYQEAVGLMAEAVSPESERGQIYAGKFWEKLLELSDSDVEVMLKISEQMEKASSLEEEDNGERTVVRHFMKRALEFFHNNRTPEGSEKAALVTMTTLFNLYYEAVGLVKEKLLPESEKGQIFAKKFGETLAKLPDGDVDMLYRLNEQFNLGHVNDEEQAAAHHFMKRALEVYFIAK